MTHYIPTEEEKNMISMVLPLPHLEQTLSQMRSFVPNRWDMVVEADVSVFDKFWKNCDHDCYIDANNIPNDLIDDYGVRKYICSKMDMTAGKVKRPSIVRADFRIKTRCIEFEDGHTRFAVLRDAGVRTIPIQIRKSQLKKFKELGLII
jgi:DNA-directed RNA polymerase subunit N (RpoN/RPB10)